jgi:hypothetical protein
MRNLRVKASRIKAQGGDIVAAQPFSRRQAVFNSKASEYAGQGVITTPGYLRLEQLLAPSVAATSLSQINFNTLDTSGVKLATERRLKLADTFTITDISFYIGTGATTVGATGAPTNAQQAQERLNTFPNGGVTAIGAANSLILESIYNGFLSLRVDTTTFLDSIPMRQFYRVGDVATGVAQSTGIAAGAGFVNQSSWPLSMFGRSELLPTIELNGQSNIEFGITLPTTVNYTQVTDTFATAVIILNGFLNQGAATVQRNVQRRLR